MLNLNRQLKFSYFTGIYDAIIPKNHLLRKIAEHIDFSKDSLKYRLLLYSFAPTSSSHYSVYFLSTQLIKYPTCQHNTYYQVVRLDKNFNFYFK